MVSRRIKMRSGKLECSRIVLNSTPPGYLTPAFSAGIYGASNALIDTTVKDNIFFSINVRTATNKTSADTSCMAAYIGNGNTADTIHNKMQGLLSSMIIGYDCFDAYAIQGTIAITDTMATHDGNANLVGGAFKASIADGKTATGNVSALYLVLGITDATTGDVATGQLDAIRIENNMTTCDSAIAIGGCTNIVNAFAFDATAGCVSAATGTTPAGDGVKIKIKVGSDTFYLRAASAWS